MHDALIFPMFKPLVWSEREDSGSGLSRVTLVPLRVFGRWETNKQDWNVDGASQVCTALEVILNNLVYIILREGPYIVGLEIKFLIGAT